MYQLFCDSNSEIPYWYAKEYGLSVVRMPYVICDEEHYYDLGEHTDFKDFYAKERAGNMPTTGRGQGYTYDKLFLRAFGHAPDAGAGASGAA